MCSVFKKFHEKCVHLRKQAVAIIASYIVYFVFLRRWEKSFSLQVTCYKAAPLSISSMADVTVAHNTPVLSNPSFTNHHNDSVITDHKYEGWNFNSGNYLFTTDTK